jgi:AcrR family transcriptional regulator
MAVQKRRAVSMAEIAADAGVSRQAVYLHFENRTQLLAALVRHVDETNGFAEMLRKCELAPDGRGLLSELITSWASYVARISDVARAMRAEAETDPDAALAWRDRMRAFTGVCKRVVARLQADGALADDWTASEAADFLATLLSIGNWQELIEERGWSKPRYCRALQQSIERTLLSPMAPPKQLAAGRSARRSSRRRS